MPGRGRNRRSLPAQGFTLIEVLVALVVLSTGIVLVLRAFDTSVVAMGESREALWASLLLREKMDELSGEVAAGQAAGAWLSGAPFARPFQEYRWTAELRTVTGGAPSGGQAAGSLHELALEVWRQGRGRRYRSESLVWTPAEE